MQKCGLASLAFYYHDFREDEKKGRRGLLASVLFQLCDQSDSYHEATFPLDLDQIPSDSPCSSHARLESQHFLLTKVVFYFSHLI